MLHTVTVHFFLRERKEIEVEMTIQVCIRCQKEKELNSDNYYRRNSRKQGFEKVCKECRSISDKERYQKSKSKFIAQKKEYYERKKEVIKERQRNYYHSNVDS